MRVIILAAGYGTRLYPLTLELPKPLIPINDKPIVNFLLDKLTGINKYLPITEVKIVSNNHFYKNFLEWKQKYGFKVKILNDGSNNPQDRLGAVRDMRFAMGQANGDWLVMGGDNLFEDDLIGFARFARSHRPYPSLGVYDIKDKTAAKRFGVVTINRQHRVTELQEKPENPRATLVASCIYYFPETMADMLGEFIAQSDSCDASGKYIAWLVSKTKVFGYQMQGNWLDIGNYDMLKLAEKIFRNGVPILK